MILKISTVLFLIVIVTIRLLIFNLPQFQYPTPNESSTIKCPVGFKTTWQYRVSKAINIPYDNFDISIARHPDGANITIAEKTKHSLTLNIEFTPYSYQIGTYNIVVAVTSSMLPFSFYSDVIHFNLEVANYTCNNGQLNLDYSLPTDSFCNCRDGFDPTTYCSTCLAGFQGDRCQPDMSNNCWLGSFNYSTSMCDCPPNLYGENCEISNSVSQYCNPSQSTVQLASFGDNGFLTPNVNQYFVSSSQSSFDVTFSVRDPPSSINNHESRRKCMKHREKKGKKDEDHEHKYHRKHSGLDVTNTKLDIYLLFDVAVSSESVIDTFRNDFEQFLLLTSQLYPDTQYGLGFIDSDRDDNSYTPIFKVGYSNDTISLDSSMFDTYFHVRANNNLNAGGSLEDVLVNSRDNIGWRKDSIRSLMYFTNNQPTTKYDRKQYLNSLLVDQYIATTVMSVCDLKYNPECTGDLLAWDGLFDYAKLSVDDLHEWLKYALRNLERSLDSPILLDYDAGLVSVSNPILLQQDIDNSKHKKKDSSNKDDENKKDNHHSDKKEYKNKHHNKKSIKDYQITIKSYELKPTTVIAWRPGFGKTQIDIVTNSGPMVSKEHFTQYATINEALPIVFNVSDTDSNLLDIIFTGSTDHLYLDSTLQSPVKSGVSYCLQNNLFFFQYSSSDNDHKQSLLGSSFNYQFKANDGCKQSSISNIRIKLK